MIYGATIRPNSLPDTMTISTGEDVDLSPTYDLRHLWLARGLPTPIADLGPYQFLPKNVQQKPKDPFGMFQWKPQPTWAASPLPEADNVWRAADKTTQYQPETRFWNGDATSGHMKVDTANAFVQKRQDRRLRSAQDEIGANSDIARRAIVELLDSGHAFTPRAFVSISDEASIAGANPHTHLRHVFGGASGIRHNIMDALHLAMRAGFHLLPGDSQQGTRGAKPSNDGVATAWTTMTAANRVAAALLGSEFLGTTQWRRTRVKFVKNKYKGDGFAEVTVPNPHPGSIHVKQKNSGPRASPYSLDELPQHEATWIAAEYGGLTNITRSPRRLVAGRSGTLPVLVIARNSTATPNVLVRIMHHDRQSWVLDTMYPT